MKEVRDADIRAEIFPDNAKMKKQMNYANAKNIPYVVFTGDTEIEAGKVTVKDMMTGGQKQVSPEELINIVKKGVAIQN